MTGNESRVKTGIAGLDVLSRGGFPRNSVNLISGPAGSG
ncbi:MAG: ATPase, partial [Thermoplasmata archaeon]|nr:ATPase [Thermoplasmata archaeon]